MKLKLACVALAGALALSTSACGKEAAKGVATTDVASTLTSQGVDAATAGKMADLYKKALDNGQPINFYGVAALPLEGTFQQFDKTFPGLHVQGTQLNAPDTITKVNSEETSGRVSVGLVSATVEAMTPLHTSGVVLPVAPIEADKIVSAAKDPSGFYANALTPWAPVVRSSMPTADRPTSWKQVASGRYKGSAAAVDPKVAGLTAGMLTYLLEAGVITADDVMSLGKAKLTPYADSGATINAVGSGEKDLMLAHSYSVFAAQKSAGGLKVDFDFPMSDANIASPLWIGMAKDAPNQAGAQLLLNYLLSVPAQKTAVAQGYIPVLQGVDPGTIFPPLDQITHLVTGPPIEKTTEVYKKWAPVLAAAFK